MSAGLPKENVPAGDTPYVEAGEVELKLRVWNPLFLKSADERAAMIIAAANEKARQEFGNDALLANVSIDSRWSPYSLLLGFDVLGFVEEGVLTAKVLVPAPPAPPPPPEPVPEPKKEVRISYPILPQGRFDDLYGYIGLEYLTRSQVLDKIKNRLDKRDADAADYEKAYSKVPEGGHLILNIGRQDLMHANTRWYAYTVTSNGNTSIDKKGAEGIPNIKGRDGNWWNVLEIPLKQPIEDSIQVSVTDMNKNLVYNFEVLRLEEEL